MSAEENHSTQKDNASWQIADPLEADGQQFMTLAASDLMQLLLLLGLPALRGSRPHRSWGTSRLHLDGI
jgi:hypothetical protein